MYFHLIWIKEKNWEKYDLDLLLSWWDEDFIRKFLWIRWVVIVSIGEFKEKPNTFWNINISVVFDDTEIQILTQWDNLDERLYFIIFLWLAPVKANYINNPISEDEVQKLIESNTLKIKEEDEKVKEQKELAELKEQKKYEESWIKDGLNIINANIERIEQIMNAWEWLLSWSEIKKLDVALTLSIGEIVDAPLMWRQRFYLRNGLIEISTRLLIIPFIIVAKSHKEESYQA